jgi:hypothetical protein
LERRYFEQKRATLSNSANNSAIIGLGPALSLTIELTNRQQENEEKIRAHGGGEELVVTVTKAAMAWGWAGTNPYILGT